MRFEALMCLSGDAIVILNDADSRNIIRSTRRRNHGTCTELPCRHIRHNTKALIPCERISNYEWELRIVFFKFETLTCKCIDILPSASMRKLNLNAR